MMNVTVTSSGAAISSLLYEQLRAGNSQEGFILGTVQIHTSEVISDSQISNEKTETTINVSSFVPCTMIGTFYSGSGDLDQEKLSNFLGSSLQNVVGWYRCRGPSCDDIFLRENIVHKQLNQIMTHASGHFILGILSTMPSDDNGTFTIFHKFMMQQQSGQFEALPLKVINMGDTSVDEYRLQPRNPALYSSSAINVVLSNLNNCEPGVTEAEALHAGLLQKLNNLLPKFSSTQKELQSALQEVTTLRLLCWNNGIPLDFTPETSDIAVDEDLMEFEEIPSSPRMSNMKGTPARSSGKRKNIGRGKNTKEEKSPPDPFGFVNKEMEKLQVRGRGSPAKRLNKSRTSTPSPRRNLTSSLCTERTPQRRSSESAGSNDGSPALLSKRSRSSNPSSSQQNSQDDDSKVKPKATRALSRTASKERNVGMRTTRNQSPSDVNTKTNKSGRPRRKEAWGDRSDSGSQEY